MPQESRRSIVHRSFVSCDDPGGVLDCKTIRRSKKKETSLKGSIDRLDVSSSVRLKEVSKGAEKLSEVVDSLFKNKVGSEPEDIGKKLLKGAVSLQESLKMLGKLQDASKFMASFKKKESKKEKYGDGKSIQRSYSERVTDHSNVIEFQKPRLSADGGSSKDCYDELRDVIRESFARQNLLQKFSPEGREFAERNMDSTIDTPSASSSQSSLFNSHGYISSGSSSSNVQSEKPKGSNLITKLMGLDELTSNPDHSLPKKPLEKSNESTDKKPILDLDLPIARKPSFVAHKAKPDKRTLGEIIEIMQSKGIMRDKPTKNWYPYEVGECSDESPPIVVMKPLHSSSPDKEYPRLNNCRCGGVSSDIKEMVKLWTVRGSVSSENVGPREALNNSTMQRKAIVDKHEVTRISREKAAKSFAEARARRKERESETRDNRSPIRPKSSSHVTSHLQKGEVIEKKVDKIHRMAPRVKNGDERNQIKEPKSGRTTVTKANRQGNTNSKLMNSTSRESVASSNQKSTITRSKTAKTLPNSAKQRKRVKSDQLSDQKIPVAVEIIGNGTIGIEINPELAKEDGMMETRIAPEHVSSKEGSHVSNVRDVLSSSISFLTRAEELFDTTADQSILMEATSLDEELLDAKLISACASELLECKCQQWELTVYPLLQHPKKRPKISVSFEHLVAKICDEIEKLKDRSRPSSDDLHIDYFCAKIEKDLWCNGAVAGAWDLGWMNAFTWDEVEQIVDDIEEQLLGVIVEDLVSDFML